MNVCVFTGPTISAADAAMELDAVYFPPAVEGDVYRASLRHPQAIGIIDGYFQEVPSVRLKEILWAMSRGIHVFGSASIGALRATELAAFGMEGVGTVFEFFRDEILEDDDEVAVAHGPAELGFPSFSEAMVNIRQTLRKAELDQVISPEVRTALEETAKQLFYPERNYSTLLRRASEMGFPEPQLARLRDWLPEGKINQKREDAVAMLRLIGRRLKEGLEPKTVSFSFEHTAMWEAVLRNDRGLRTERETDAGGVPLESLLEELRLKGDQYQQSHLLALERYFAIREADRQRLNITEESREEAELSFRQERDLHTAAQLDQWMKENGLDRHRFEALMSDEARLKMVRERAWLGSDGCLSDQIRLSGEYPQLWKRAAKKEQVLAAFGSKNLSLENAEVTEEELFRWYFEQVLERPVPVDISAYAQRVGFTHLHAFRRAVLREYAYRRFAPGAKISATHRRASGTAGLCEEGRTLDRVEGARG
jgi:hypothetical protein